MFMIFFHSTDFSARSVWKKNSEIENIFKKSGNIV